MASQPLFNPADFEDAKIVADIEVIRRYNWQRFDMEHLTAIVYDEPEVLCVGYKDTSDEEFWVPGHMPGMPLMPGVIQCEAAAQLCNYHVGRHKLMGDMTIGFGGMDEIRFREPVLPGDRLVIGVKLEKIRKGRMSIARFQGYANNKLAVEGRIIGVPLPVEALKEHIARRQAE